MVFDSTYDYLFKVLLVGDSGVGKSSLLLRFADNQYSESYMSTIGLDFKIRSITNDITNKTSKLQIWDTAGQERFKTITSSYYRGSDGIILVFDITSRASFQHIDMWYSHIMRYVQHKFPMILVGNKCDQDINRQVSYNEANEYARLLGMPYMETSAKEDTHIEKCFQTLEKNMIQVAHKQISHNIQSSKVDLLTKHSKKWAGCC